MRQVLVIVGSLAAGVFFLLLSAHAPLALFVAMIGFVAAFVWSAKYAKALMALADARKRTQPGGNVEKAGMPHPGPAASCELAAAASIHDSEETRP